MSQNFSASADSIEAGLSGIALGSTTHNHLTAHDDIAYAIDVRPLQTRVGMGVHPFNDPTIIDEFAAETVGIDARESHSYAAKWTTDAVEFYVDERSAFFALQQTDERKASKKLFGGP